MALPNTTFTGYSPDRMRQLAQSYGYNDANLAGFGKFLQANPSRAKQYFDQQNMDMFGPDRMRQFQAGGAVTPTIPNPWQSQIAETKRELKQVSGVDETDPGYQQVQDLEQQLRGYEQQWQQYQTDQQLKQDANTGTQLPVADHTGVIAPSTGTQVPATQTDPRTEPGTPKSDRPNFGFQSQRGAGLQVIQNWYNPKTGENYTAGQPGALPPSADWTTNPNESQATRDLRHANWDAITREWNARQEQFGPGGNYIGPEQTVESDMGSYNYYIDPSQNVGNSPPAWESQQQQQQPQTSASIQDETVRRMYDPRLPPGTEFQKTYIPFEQAQLVSQAAGKLTTTPTVGAVTTVTPAEAIVPTARTATEIAAATAGTAAQDITPEAALGQAPSQTIEAAQQEQTQVANVQAAQATQAAQVQAPDARGLVGEQIQPGEQIAAPTGQATQAAEFVAPTAATAAPTEAATVQGQLATLLQQFESGEVPAWAKGAIRTAQQTLLARGLGASSMAGQAIVQAAMEAALPIAQLDAAMVSKFEAQNLTNRQQAAMVHAQYRAQFMGQEFDQAFQTRVQNAAKVSDIANRNFTADQQIALENSKLIHTVNLANLSNSQALVMANAGALSQLDIANLNNRQQAAVQNSQNFLQVDLKNTDNSQQAAIIGSQQQLQALLTDTAAENTVRQINATNQQQVDQYYDNLITTASQWNASQANAILRGNAGDINSIAVKNAELRNMQEQFEATNRVAIDQSNAVWRRKIATEDTAVANFENQLNAQNSLNMSNQAYNNLWQEVRDMVEFAFTAGEGELERMTTLQLAALNADANQRLNEFKMDREDSRSIGGYLFDIFKEPLTSFVTEGLFGLG